MQCRAPVSDDDLLEYWTRTTSDQEEARVEEHLFACAAKQVRDRVQDATWQAFWETTVDGKSAKDVAAELHMTVAAVYLAKSRVLKRLRQEIAVR